MNIILEALDVHTQHWGPRQKWEQVEYKLPEDKICTVYFFSTFAFFQYPSIAHHSTLLKLGAGIRHILCEIRHDKHHDRPNGTWAWSSSLIGQWKRHREYILPCAVWHCRHSKIPWGIYWRFQGWSGIYHWCQLHIGVLSRVACSSGWWKGKKVHCNIWRVHFWSKTQEQHMLHIYSKMQNVLGNSLINVYFHPVRSDKMALALGFWEKSLWYSLPWSSSPAQACHSNSLWGDPLG